MPHLRGVFIIRCLLLFAIGSSTAVAQTSKVSEEAAKRAVSTIPTKIEGAYRNGKLIELNVKRRPAYLVVPTEKIDSDRRWIWICPFWLGIHNGHGVLEHRFYVERYLEAGFHVAGINVGTSCGSPSAAEVMHDFYRLVQKDYQLNKRCRIVGQSNGGLIAYSWAFRHPECVDKIAGICPATDFRTWPTLPNVINYPDKGLGYNLSLEELTNRIIEFNPIDNLAPLAKANVRILHIHGDKDELVPMKENSTILAQRYRDLGGKAEIVALEGLGHGGIPLYESLPFVTFLVGD